MDHVQEILDLQRKVIQLMERVRGLESRLKFADEDNEKLRKQLTEAQTKKPGRPKSQLVSE